jgi:threonine/homoserine/homoserine lactone efflux protein
MDLRQFLVETVLISLSGVMAPGPVTAITIGKGSRSAPAGALIALGHGCVELPLMILLMLGVGRFVQEDTVRTVIAAIGGIFLLVLGIGMLGAARKAPDPARADSRSPLVIGIVASAANPYFLVWWATVGMTLLARARAFGPEGFAAFAIVHWLCDLVWLSALSLAAFKGARFLGPVFQRSVSLACGVVLVVFGVRFLTGT